MVGVRIRDAAGTLRTVTRIRMRDAGGVLRTIQRIRMRDATNALRTVYQYLTATTNRAIITGTGNNVSPVDITTNNATITPVGGTGPFTYAWTKLDDFGSRWTVNSPTAAMTNVTCTAVAAGEYVTLALTCLVTDSLGATALVQVAAEVQNLAIAP